MWQPLPELLLRSSVHAMRGLPELLLHRSAMRGLLHGFHMNKKQHEKANLVQLII